MCSQLRKRGGNAGGVVTQRCACYSRCCRLEFEHAAAAASPGRAAGDRPFARVVAAAAPSAAPDTLPCQDFLTWLNEMMVKDSSEYAGYGATPLPLHFFACTCLPRASPLRSATGATALRMATKARSARLAWSGGVGLPGVTQTGLTRRPTLRFVTPPQPHRGCFEVWRAAAVYQAGCQEAGACGRQGKAVAFG